METGWCRGFEVGAVQRRIRGDVADDVDDVPAMSRSIVASREMSSFLYIPFHDRRGIRVLGILRISPLLS
jgi:hypothetical protein